MLPEQRVGWNEIEELVKILARKIQKLPQNFTSITTVSRGGLIPSRLMADHLGIKKIFVDKRRINSSSLFVDDIYDSGDTFNKIISKVDVPSKLVFATLFARLGKTYPNQLVYAKKTESTSYVVFPWDRLEFQNFKK